MLRYRINIGTEFLFIFATKTACKLDWLQVVEISGVKKMKYDEVFSGRKPNFANHLQTFGEVGVLTTADRKIKDKVNMWGVVCMMGGYTSDHAGDVYRMYNPLSNEIYESRDIEWLNRLYFCDANRIVENSPITSVEEKPYNNVGNKLVSKKRNGQLGGNPTHMLRMVPSGSAKAGPVQLAADDSQEENDILSNVTQGISNKLHDNLPLQQYSTTNSLSGGEKCVKKSLGTVSEVNGDEVVDENRENEIDNQDSPRGSTNIPSVIIQEKENETRDITRDKYDQENEEYDAESVSKSGNKRGNDDNCYHTRYGRRSKMRKDKNFEYAFPTCDEKNIKNNNIEAEQNQRQRVRK